MLIGYMQNARHMLGRSAADDVIRKLKVFIVANQAARMQRVETGDWSRVP